MKASKYSSIHANNAIERNVRMFDPANEKRKDKIITTLGMKRKNDAEE